MKTSSKTNPYAFARRTLSASALGFIAVLIASPAISGISIPDSPLQSSSTIPPNIMFILDDSGSMGETFMAAPEATSDTEPTTNAPDIGQLTYARNGIYYNPATTYTPWSDYLGTGNYVADVTYNAAYSSLTLASAASGTTNLSSSVQTYYVPKNLTDSTLAYLIQPANYWRYQIRTDGRVIRSEYVGYVAPPATALAITGTPNPTGSITNGNLTGSYTIIVPPGLSSLTIRSSGGTGNSANLYIRIGSAPTTGTYDFRNNTSGTNNETRTITNPTAGTYYVRLHANGSNFSGVSISADYIPLPSGADGCDTSTSGTGWRNCFQTTPTGRSEADERLNFARWYSFQRTRSKVAKAGAGEAFSSLSSDFRVGFTTIWNRSTYYIPVGTDNGLFRNETTPTATTNRSVWFDRLYAATASSTTPLLPALQRAGNYYSDTLTGATGAAGPYGPEAGSLQLSCRQNYAILTTDGFWNNTTGYTSVGNSDNTTTSAIPLPATVSGTPIGYTAANPYRDSYSDTLADVANYYWKTDLRTLTNNVPTTSNDPAYWQHMVTFGVSIGLKGRLDPVLDLPRLTAGTPNVNGTTGWPNPLDAVDPDRIDDLFHASVNGHGKFIAALNPTQFADGLRAALAAIAEVPASNSNASANSTSLDTDSRIFQAKYRSGKWTGELLAYSIDASTGVISSTPSWSASAVIPAYGSRNILTWTGTSASGSGATFPTAAQTTALTTPIANYVAGSRTGEGTTYRTRDHLLGDIVNSSPAYVKDTDSVYIAANDGMLHGFNASTGVEQFAYVPLGISLPNLKTLSDPAYTHRYFADGAIVVSTRRQTTGSSNFIAPNNNKNILVGALGRGGKGVFALDVTTPTAMTSTDVKWESDTTDVDMGNVLGRPFIAKLNNGMTGVIVANGPNSTNEKAVLFVYNLNTGAVIAKIDTLDGSAANPNGLSSPVGWDDDNDGDLDYVYSGDNRGNMWRFNLTSTTASNWSLAANRVILHTALSSTSVRQPISGRPTIARDPLTFKRWVFFGTGRFITLGDSTDQSRQTWYGIQDNGTNIADRTSLQQRKIAVTGEIITYDSGGVEIDRTPVRGFEPAASLSASLSGWYIDLVLPPTPPGTAEGERMVGDQKVENDILFAASIIPGSTGCSVGGRGFINAINAFTGTSVSEAYFDVDGDGRFDDDVVGTGGAQVPVGSVDLGVGMVTNPLILNRNNGRTANCASGSSGALGCVGGAGDNRVGRISWREVLGN